MTAAAAAKGKKKATNQGSVNPDSFVPALLTFIANSLTTSGSAAYRRRFGIGVMEFRLMVMLDLEPGCSGTRIAEAIGLDKAAVSRTIASLERHGLVIVSRGPGNVHAIRLTKRGAALYQSAREIAIEREQRLFNELSLEEQETLRILLHKLSNALPYVAQLAKEGDSARKKPTKKQPKGLSA